MRQVCGGPGVLLSGAVGYGEVVGSPRCWGWEWVEGWGFGWARISKPQELDPAAQHVGFPSVIKPVSGGWVCLWECVCYT
jgi:hypothetical protein